MQRYGACLSNTFNRVFIIFITDVIEGYNPPMQLQYLGTNLHSQFQFMSISVLHLCSTEHNLCLHLYLEVLTEDFFTYLIK